MIDIFDFFFYKKSGYGYQSNFFITSFDAWIDHVLIK